MHLKVSDNLRIYNLLQELTIFEIKSFEIRRNKSKKKADSISRTATTQLNEINCSNVRAERLEIFPLFFFFHILQDKLFSVEIGSSSFVRLKSF